MKLAFGFRCMIPCLENSPCALLLCIRENWERPEAEAWLAKLVPDFTDAECFIMRDFN